MKPTIVRRTRGLLLFARSSAAIAAIAAIGACASDAPPDLPEQVAGRCTYTNEFADAAECRDYLGPWDLSAARADCDDWNGKFEADARCASDDSVGWCILDKDSDTPIRVSFPGGSCSENERGCELFGGGLFVAEARCGAGGGGGDTPDDVLSNPFPEPVESCVEPLPGDAPGNGPDGTVCQRITMQGCTEPDRTWEEYGSCEIPREQRGYYPVDVRAGAEDPDPRLDDPTYVAELTWVKSQLASCSCFCCHSSKSPEGPSNWYLEQQGNFVNGMFDTGIAQGAGVIDSTVLGDLEPEQNNGFTRMPSVFPSTDPMRMQLFFQREFEHRGLRVEDFEGLEMYGPLSEQWNYEPKACANGEGVDADGKVTWRGGGARIVHVLEADARNPGAPPNLDTPDGTLWRLDAVDPTVEMLKSGVRYGDVEPGAVQRVPAAGQPVPLDEGRTYLLYVSADYLQPITRCLFVR